MPNHLSLNTLNIGPISSSVLPLLCPILLHLVISARSFMKLISIECNLLFICSNSTHLSRPYYNIGLVIVLYLKLLFHVSFFLLTKELIKAYYDLTTLSRLSLSSVASLPFFLIYASSYFSISSRSITLSFSWTHILLFSVPTTITV